MKHILIICVMTITFATAPAVADVVTYNFTFAGGGATTTGSITFDLALLTNPGRNLFDISAGGDYSAYGTNIPGLVTALSLTVSGATNGTGDGTYTLSDFDGVLFDTSTVGLNLAPGQQLVGQSVVTGTGSGTWGTSDASTIIIKSDPVQSWTGDFQLFSPVASDAPYGSNPFEITTAGGDAMQLTSMYVTPEPSTYALLCISLGVVGFARKRLGKRER